MASLLLLLFIQTIVSLGHFKLPDPANTVIAVILLVLGVVIVLFGGRIDLT